MNLVLVQSLFVFALFAPVGAIFSALVTRRFSWGNTMTQLILVFSSACGLIAAGYFYVLISQGAPSVDFIQIPGIVGLSAGPVGIFFLALIYGGTFLTSLYAIESLPTYRDMYSLPWLNVASSAFIIGMQATVLSQSLFTFLIFWEVMSVAAYFLVIADRSKESLEAGWLYLIMTHIGLACLTMGFLLLAQGDIFAHWSEVAASVSTLSPLVQTMAFLLLFAGFGSKAGLVPLHQWLPYAHPQAPSGSSALLSGVMLKVALFGFLQAIMLFSIVPISWVVTIVVVGLVSALFGAVHAAVENDAKRLLAWSSVENMGLIFSGVGAAMLIHALVDPRIAEPLVAGATIFVVMHTINHFLFKTGLFMAVGAVASKTHTRDLDLLGGLAQKWPFFSGVFLALSLAAAALPPLGTFFGEWAYFQALAVSIAASSPLASVGFAVMLSIIALVGGLAIFAYVKMFSAIFLGRARSVHAHTIKPMPLLLMLPSVVCVVSSVAVGLMLPAFTSSGPMGQASRWMSDVTMVPLAAINPWLVAYVAVGIVALLVIFRRTMTSVRTPRITDTWDCGAPLTERMQYTATGFSAPIRFFFRTLLLSRKELIVVPVSAANPWIAGRQLTWSTSSFWEYWMYRPIGLAIEQMSRLVRKLQSGIIQVYLVLILCALVGALITAL